MQKKSKLVCIAFLLISAACAPRYDYQPEDPENGHPIRGGVEHNWSARYYPPTMSHIPASMDPSITRQETHRDRLPDYMANAPFGFYIQTDAERQAMRSYSYEECVALYASAAACNEMYGMNGAMNNPSDHTYFHFQSWQTQ